MQRWFPAGAGGAGRGHPPDADRPWSSNGATSGLVPWKIPVVELSEANRAALAQVRAHAAREQPRHLARIARVLDAAGVAAGAEALVAAAGRQGTLTLNFHPDRLLADGRSVAQALHDDAVYRSQFETGISNGGLTAHPGGDRDVWEHALFAGAYQAPGVTSGERPKYGGLNLMNHRNGACPRFGSCHLRLRPPATRRATLIFGDSAAQPTDIGLIDALAPVMAPLLERIAAGGGALGRAGVDVRAFAGGVLRGDVAARRGAFAPAMTHTLNDYVEAQVHGVLDLARDVDALVLDPAFAGTPEGEWLLATARRYGCAAEWHAGLALALPDVPRDAPDVPEGDLMRWQVLCRGGRALRLAERVIEEAGSASRLDAATIGRAAAGVVRDPLRWRDWGAPADVLVHLKDLWLMLVAHGEPG
jgi:uncharacterized protein DUF3626